VSLKGITGDDDDDDDDDDDVYIYLVPTNTTVSTTNFLNMWQFSRRKSLRITSAVCNDMRGTAGVVLVVQLPQTARSKGLENGTQNVYLKRKKIRFSALNTF